MTDTQDAKRPCVKCGGDNILPVVYGLPTPETFARAALGEVLLGGCVVFGSEPDWRCADCGEPWEGEPTEDWAKELVNDTRKNEKSLSGEAGDSSDPQTRR